MTRHFSEDYRKRAGVTTPGDSQFFTPDLASQYTKILGAHPIFTTRPNVAAALAQANPDRFTAQIVGGFLQSLETTKQVRLARAGGAKLVLNDQDRAYLTMLGETYDDVDAAPVLKQIDAKQKAASAAGAAAPAQTASAAGVQVPESHGLFGHVAAIGKGAAHLAAQGAELPGVHQVLTGLDAAADATRGVARVPGVSTVLGLSGPSGVVDDTVENIVGMADRGYDPGNPLSVLSFYAQGEKNYHSLDDLRSEYSGGAVKAAQDYLEHPESFDISADVSDAENVRRIEAVNDPRWKELLDKVDSRHMSVGRDMARATGLQAGTKPYHMVSGALDAVESWFVDPTVVGGKLAKVNKLRKLGIESLTDEAGIRRMLAETGGNASVKRGWQGLLDNAKVIRTGTDAEKAAAYAAIRSSTPELVPLVDEINGKTYHVVNKTSPLAKGVSGPQKLVSSTMEATHAAPIETMGDLTEYLVNKNALVRTLRGAAPKTGVYMPGAVSRFGAAKAKLVQSTGLTAAERHEAKLVDLASTDAARVIATPEDAVSASLQAAATRGDDLAKLGKGARGRFLTASRRLSTLIPTTTSIDFYAPGATDMVYKWAQIAMPKSEARMLAANFSAADLGGRRTIYKAMMEQSIHASGMESSATGRALAARMRGDAVKADTQKYSMADDADRLADEAGVRNVAVFPGQLDRDMFLPSFTEMRKAAAKVSLYDHTLRRVADNSVVDRLMSTMRLGWMVTSASGLRNIMDNLAGATASGQGWNTVKAKLARSEAKSARAIERELPAGAAPFKTEAEYHKARIHRVLTNISRVKASALGRFSSDEFAEAAHIMGEEIAQGHVSQLGVATTALVTGIADPHNLEQVAEITKMGARPAEIGFGRWEQKGWGEVASDGEVGARNWAHNLDQVIGETPILGRLLIKALRSPDKDRWLNGLGGAHRDILIQHIVEHPEMAEYRELAELAKGIKTATTPELKREAAHMVADRMIRSLDALVTGRDGNLIHPLLDRLESGQVPSLDWFAANVPTKVRPEKVIGREWAPVVAKPDLGGVLGVGQMVGRGYTKLLSAGYQAVVTGPISRMSSHPVFLGNFVKARRNLAGYEQSLIDQGLGAEAARLHSTKLALDHAMDMTGRMIDNPEVASQMATLSRNLMNFPRAAEDWVRRWSRIVKEDPSKIRKIQMAIEGGQHSGIIDRDDQGNLILTYPGSGAVINAVLKVGEALRIPGIASIPTVPDLKTNLLYLNPSLNNPFYPGASPLIVTPVKISQGFFPGSKLMLQDLQTALTGDDRGASQGVMEQFFPGVVKSFFKALTADEQSAQLGSAAMNAIVHLDAAGLDPDAQAAKEGRAPNADDREKYLARVKLAAKNQLVLRAIFAFVLPGSPSLPENDTGDDSSKSDALFQAQGLSSLSDEARVLVAKLGYERALAVWTKLHPDKLMFLVGRTESNAPYGSVSPTRGAELWLENNLDFVKEHPSIAAYFVPEAPGDFSPEAYRSQMEEGLRTRKGLDKFYSDIRVITAEQTYYAVKDHRDKVIAEAKARGDSEGVATAKATWTAWTQGDGQEPGFLNLNPLFAAKLASYGERTVWREQAVGELSSMLESGKFGDVNSSAGGDTVSLGKSGHLPVDTATAQGVAALVHAYHEHNAFTDAMRGKRDKDSLLAKDNEQRGYDKYMLGVTGASYDADGRLTGGNAALRDLYQGLFRGLD